MSSPGEVQPFPVRSTVPTRLDRLPWSKGITLEPVGVDTAIELHPQGTLAYRDLARVVPRDYRRRSLVGFSLMVTGRRGRRRRRPRADARGRH